ncbi:BatA and WFA domain-containing protein [Flavobacterium sp. 14A]|uniref:vWA domain-containing protein n=1 Tax=Flavobacterium sp. 14A TaxID=2735896 RepID=UPI001571361D|nr:BatA and WFA domain-containing protein [Flavobacterium sp. 14A]NRT11862.1 hypothetical protein [Flavobacterium sp. 14A]
MQLKHPEILYFLFLLLVPIIVHLFRLRRFKTQVFTNVRLLKTIKAQTQKNSQIKKWLLLSCRLLLLTAAIFAFAQPYFPAKDTDNSKNQLFIVLDNSYSMQAKGKKGELLKRAVQELLEDMPETEQFSLLTNTESFWNTDIKSIKSELQNLKYSAIPFSLESQINKINSQKTAYNKDIVVISDAPQLEPNSSLIDSKNMLYFFIPQNEQKSNTAIDSVFISESTGNFHELNVKVSQHGTTQSNIPIAVYDGNKLLVKSQLNFKKGSETVTFNIPKEAFNGYVSIEDGAMAYDNKLFFSLSELKKSKVMSITDTNKNSFLSRIYTPSEFDFQTVALNGLSYNQIEKQDAILLDELTTIPQALQTNLKTFVQNGGNLIVIPNRDFDEKAYNSLLTSFATMQLKTAELTERKITKINFDHPLYSNVFENKVTNFQYPTTKSSLKIVGSGSQILGYSDQSSFLSSTKFGVGTVYLFAAAINSVNSNLQQSPLIVPTFYKMGITKQLGNIKALTIGNNETLLVAAKINKEAVLKVENKTEQFIPMQQVITNNVQLYFSDLPLQAGNFVIKNKDSIVETISFNYSRTESDLAPAKIKKIENAEIIPSIESYYENVQSSRTDNQIWKWFVIFALFFLLSEMAIIKFIK